MNRINHQRKGGLLVAVVVCMVIVSTMSLGILASALRQHRELRLHKQMQQTQLLVDSGLRKGIQSIALDPNYSGETWSPTLPNMNGKSEVVIQILPRQCIVTATIRPKHGQITQRTDKAQLP